MIKTHSFLLLSFSSVRPWRIAFTERILLFCRRILWVNYLLIWVRHTLMVQLHRWSALHSISFAVLSRGRKDSRRIFIFWPRINIQVERWVSSRAVAMLKVIPRYMKSPSCLWRCVTLAFVLLCMYEPIVCLVQPDGYIKNLTTRFIG